MLTLHLNLGGELALFGRALFVLTRVELVVDHALLVGVTLLFLKVAVTSLLRLIVMVVVIKRIQIVVVLALHLVVLVALLVRSHYTLVLLKC